MKQKFLLLIALLITAAITTNAQTTYYVDATKADNTGAGTSWATAKKDVQNAINAAASGDEVWVKAGTYKPTAYPTGATAVSPAVLSNRDYAIHLKDGVKLYGGFAGTETTLAQRNWTTNLTTLSGDIGTANDNTDNCYHVVVSVSDAATTLLNGFTISNGYGKGSNVTNVVTVENINLTRRSGGGVCSSSSNVTISNCSISNNLIDGQGGGLYSANSTTTSISNCNFNSNTAASSGGAIFISSQSSTSPCSLSVSNCIFCSNTVESVSGGGGGGGITNSSNVTSNINNSTFYGNKAIGTSSPGGGIYFATTSGGTIKDCILYNNTTPSNSTDANREEIYSFNTTASTKVNVSYSIVKDYTTAGTINITAGTGIITSDPLFASTSNLIGADNKWMTADDGLRIGCSSPAKDVGTGTTPITDIIGNTHKGTMDLGAYEAVNGTTASNTLPTVYTTLYIPQTAAPVNYTDCINQICKVDGTSPYTITGDVAAKVWIESTQSTQYAKRHYEITPATNATTATGKVTLYFTQAEFDDFNAVSSTDLPTGNSDATGIANLRIEKFPGTSSNGTGLPSTYTGTPVTIDPADADIVWNATASRWEVSFDVTGFSGFFVKTITTILPLQWLNVTGSLNTNKQAVLNFKVNETNVANYSVEKSTDGRTFAAIGNLSSQGNGENAYQFTEPQALNNVAYYRIKQIDADGRYSYSSIVKLNTYNSSLITVFPNPVKDIVTISGATIGSKAMLTDISGKILQQINITANSFIMDISAYSSGIYLLKANGATQKIIKE